MSDRGIVSNGTHATTIEGLDDQFVYETVASSGAQFVGTVIQDHENDTDPLEPYEGYSYTNFGVNYSRTSNGYIESAHEGALEYTQSGFIRWEEDVEKTVSEIYCYVYFVEKPDSKFELQTIEANFDDEMWTTQFRDPGSGNSNIEVENPDNSGNTFEVAPNQWIEQKIHNIDYTNQDADITISTETGGEIDTSRDTNTSSADGDGWDGWRLETDGAVSSNIYVDWLAYVP